MFVLTSLNAILFTIHALSAGFAVISILSLSAFVLVVSALVFFLFFILKSQKKQTVYEHSFKKLVEGAKDIIYTTDIKGNFDYVNEATYDYTGFTKEELIGKSYKVLVRNDYKHQISAYYKKQIKEKVHESYCEFPFNTKQGKTLWVGQSVLFKYDNGTGDYLCAQVICRDITERVLAEENLRQHILDLKVINEIKELILTSGETSNLYVKILLLLGGNSDKSDYYSINIFDQQRDLLHTYSLNTKDKSVSSTGKQTKYSLASELTNLKKRSFNFTEDVSEKQFLKQLHQPCEKYKSAVIQPITSSAKTYGFIGFYSERENAYPESHLILVNDICTALSSYFVQYEQKQLIKDYSKQLEILNESKTKLLSYNTLTDVYKGIIDLLYEEIQNVYRLSIIIHDSEKNIGNMIFRDVKSPEISVKIINTGDLPFLQAHLSNVAFDKPDFENDISLSTSARLWYEPDVMAVYSVPVFVNQQLYASVSLVSRTKNNFTDQHKALINDILTSACNVIEQLIYKEIISEKSKDISDNINYARRIQNALMPSGELLNKILPKSFLIFNQRDSLGGDFYWFEKSGDNTFITVGDCTGHGVSGSLLTILASDYIKQAVEVKKFTDPGLILEHLRDSLHATLNKYSTEDEIIDGLDISFGVFNSTTKTFLYASAMHNFFLVRNNELTEYKGNKKPIGGAAAMENSYYFTTHLFQLQTNDVVYFSTDGYYDQLQHKTEKRFGKGRLKQLLLLISDKDMAEQKNILLEQHAAWKGNLKQTDDICLLGFKVE